MPITPTSNCIPVGTVDVNAQTLALDCTYGNLAISGGNQVNLACIVSNFQTVSTLSSVTLTGTNLQIIFIGEDGVQQAKNVDLSSLIGSNDGINVANSNSILLNFASNTLSANLNIDPASSMPITASGAGVKFGCCPETPITANTTNTILFTSTGSNGYVLSANLKYQSSSSVALSDTSAGLSATVRYSTDANNVAIAGTDGGIYVQSASSQLSSLANNGYVTTGTAGTLLVGSDSKLYRIATPAPETSITAINTNTISTVVNGLNNHTITSTLLISNSDTVQLSATSGGLQATVKIDTATPGNVVISSDSNGLVANVTETGIASVQNTAATVQNPMTSIFGTLNNGAGGFAAGSLSQYGLKFPSFTTTQRIAIPTADLYDTMFVFDNTIRAFMWYDAIALSWNQLT